MEKELIRRGAHITSLKRQLQESQQLLLDKSSNRILPDNVNTSILTDQGNSRTTVISQHSEPENPFSKLKAMKKFGKTKEVPVEECSPTLSINVFTETQTAVKNLSRSYDTGTDNYKPKRRPEPVLTIKEELEILKNQKREI